jgi:hypothetical protein
MKALSKAVLVAVALSLPAVGICADTGAKSHKKAGKVIKISDVYKNKDSLDKQQVTVKGKVVKVSSGIMDRNWVHIQDGSGNARAKNNDLTVTTSEDTPEVGKTVTATGTIAKGKDFGSGYYYDVIMEQGTFK